MRFPTLSINPEDAGQGVADGWAVMRQRDFTGCENLALLPEAVKRNQFIRMENAMISQEGEVVNWWQMDTPAMTFSDTITGLALLPIADEVNAIQFYHTLKGTDTVTVGYFDTTPNAEPIDLATAGTTNEGVTDASIKGLFLATSFLGKVYCPNGNGGVLNLTDLTVITNGILTDKTLVKLAAYDNRLWGVTDDGKIVFSDNGDAATWNVLNIIALPNSEPVIDFVPVDSGVIITHRNGAYAMYGSGDYQDTMIRAIQNAAKDPALFSDSAVVIGNAVFLIGNRGIFRITLNGIEEIPHFQGKYFDSLYNVWNATTYGKVQGVYLYKFHAIFWLFQTEVNLVNDTRTSTLTNDEDPPITLTNDKIRNSGMLFYVSNGGICKTSEGLAMGAPFLLSIQDRYVDFLFFRDEGTVGKSIYPAGTLSTPRQSVIQTRHEDCDSTRNKVWKRLSITVAETVYNVSVFYYLDGISIPILACSLMDLKAGQNDIDLYDTNGNEPESRTVSFEIIIGDGITVSKPVTFTIKELKLKYRETGGNE